MTYLDSSRVNELIRTHPDRFPPREIRLVGVEREYDSGYHRIVRFFGPHAVDPDQIKIEIRPGLFQIPDPLIRDFAGKVAQQLREEGRLYDGPTVTGYRALDLDSTPPKLTVQETTYADFAGSLFALDLEAAMFAQFGGTLRDYCLTTDGNKPYSERPLANCFGVCGHLLIEEDSTLYLLQIRRAARLATLAGTRGPSAAGSVDFKPDYRSAKDMLQRQLGLEVQEELGLHYDEFSITPLAFALEIFRGDNPQLFGLIRTTLDREEISRRLNSLPEQQKEFSELSFLPLNQSGQLAVSERESLNFEATMSYFLLEEYLHEQE